MKNIIEICKEEEKEKCFFLNRWAEKVHWMRLNNPSGPRIMPNLDGLRINYCPTCGAYIREVQLDAKQNNE